MDFHKRKSSAEYTVDLTLDNDIVSKRPRTKSFENNIDFNNSNGSGSRDFNVTIEEDSTQCKSNSSESGDFNVKTEENSTQGKSNGSGSGDFIVTTEVDSTQGKSNGSGSGDFNVSTEVDSTQDTQPYSLNGQDWLDDGYFDKVMKQLPRVNSDLKLPQKDGVTDSTFPVPNHSSNGCISKTGDDDEFTEAQILPHSADMESYPSPSTQEKTLKKIGSVQKDADTIASMLDMKDTQAIYSRLLQKRRISNRIEVVMDEILEGGIEQLKEKCARDAEEEKNSEKFDKIFSDVEEVLRIIKSNYSNLNCDPNNVYPLLEKNFDKENRVQYVVDYILGSQVSVACGSLNKDSATNGTDTYTETKLIEDINVVLKKVKNGDPNVVHSLLVENADDEDRVNCVCSLLEDWENPADSSNKHTEASMEEKSEEDSSDHSQYNSDPVYKDMKIISKMFPDKDRNEIYAYLEAHFDKTNRIQIVTEELLGMNENSQESQSVSNQFKSVPAESDSQSVLIPTPNPEPSDTEKEVSTLMSIFPDCDPNFLYSRLEDMSTIPARVEKLSASLLENRNYPKLKDVLEKEQIVSQRLRLQKLQMTPAEFVKLFPDPEAYFFDEDKPVTESYKSHAMIHLRNVFPMIHIKYINKKFIEHKEHLAPTVTALQSLADEFTRSPRKAAQMKRFRKTLRITEELMPDKADELFYRELFYIREKQNIQEFIQRHKDEKAMRLQMARERGELNECACCYDNECMFEDMGSCPEGHLFCKECIRCSSEEVIGQAKVSFPCLAGDCPTEFSLAVLQDVLTSKMFSLLLRKIQEEEIRKADIADLVNCPFCSFATIISNEEDKVFRCMNPECLRESCRLCKEPNHIPLRCEEVEKQGETSMRAFIENKITEAMVRTCWKCKKRFYKTEGCNKMTCTCGASMCYVCRKPVKDYSHFGRGGCPQDTNVFELHRTEMEKAAREAKEKYEAEHPEVKGTTLKYDPVKHIKDLKNNVPGQNEEYDDEEIYEDDDYEEDIDGYDEYDENDDEYGEEDEETDMEYIQALLEYKQLHGLM